MNIFERKLLELDQKTEPIANEFLRYKGLIHKALTDEYCYGVNREDYMWITYLAHRFDEYKRKLDELAKEEAILNEIRKEMMA